jgi:hypothetical protein
MKFLIYQKDHKETFKALKLQYIDINEFLIKVAITVADDVGAVLTRHPGAAAHMQEATHEAVAAALAGPLKSLKRWLAGRERAIGKAQFGAAEELRAEILGEFQDRRSAITARVGETAAKAAIDDIAGFMARSDNAAALDLRQRAFVPWVTARSATVQPGGGAASIGISRGADAAIGMSGAQAITDGMGKTAKGTRAHTIPRRRLLHRAKRRLEAVVAACETEAGRAKQTARIAGGRGKRAAADGIANLADGSNTMVDSLIAALRDDVKMLEETTAYVRVGFDRLSQRLLDLLDMQDELLAELKRPDGEPGVLDGVDSRGNESRKKIEKTKKKLERIGGATARILPRLEALGAFIAAEEKFIEEYHRKMQDLA